MCQNIKHQNGILTYQCTKEHLRHILGNVRPITGFIDLLLVAFIKNSCKVDFLYFEIRNIHIKYHEEEYRKKKLKLLPMMYSKFNISMRRKTVSTYFFSNFLK